MKKYLKSKIKNSGITILLVMLIVSSLLAIAAGIFNFVIGELKLSGNVNDSFQAIYAADEGAERVLFDDRVSGLIDSADGVYCWDGSQYILGSSPCSGVINTAKGNCYIPEITRNGGNTILKVVGKNSCAGSVTFINRAFEVRY